MDLRIQPLAEILRLNTRLFRNCLRGISDAQARERLSNDTNSMVFVAAHLAESRFFILRMLGADRPSSLERYLEHAHGIDEMEEFPSLSEIQSAWTDGAHALRDRLALLTAEELDAVIEKGFPVPDQSILSALAFLVQHESYHLGQLALLRKHAGFPAMSYM